MIKQSKQFKKLSPTISQIIFYIETKVGGTVYPFDDPDLKAVNLRWKKMDPNSEQVLRYNYKVSYDELKSVEDGIIIASGIVDKITKGVEDA